MMDLDQIAQRLEELSLELDNDELQGLANALSAAENAPCQKCAGLRDYERLVEEFMHQAMRTNAGQVAMSRFSLRDSMSDYRVSWQAYSALPSYPSFKISDIVT